MSHAAFSKPPRRIWFVAASCLVVCSLSTTSALAQTPACQSVTDDLSRLPTNYGSFTPPAKGATYTDAAFGCTIRRLTDAAAEYPGEDVGMTHLYSSVSPFNTNSTFVLLQKTNGTMQVRDLNGNILAGNDDLSPLGIQDEGQPVWSRTDPNLLYFTARQSPPCSPYCKQVLLQSYNVQTSAVTLLHDFSTLDPSFDRVQIGWGEGDISWDGTRLPLIACSGAEKCDPFTSPYAAWVFVHNLSDGSNTPPQPVTGQNVDNNDLTPSNRMVVQRMEPLPGQADLYDENALNPVRVLDFAGHWDRGQDTDGTDMLVLVNSRDATPLPNCPGTPDGMEIVKFRLTDLSEHCLRTIPWDPWPPIDWLMGVHISCNNVGHDWCLVSTYADPTKVNSINWPYYAFELLMIKLDGSHTIRLAHTRSSGNGNGDVGYWKSPRAAVSPDGKYVLFDSDMSDNCETDPTCPQPDVYLLILPSAPVAENVVWINLVNATATNPLQKTGGCDGCEDAGATSQQQILSGDGYVEFNAVETTTTRGAGLSNGDTDTSGADVDFAIALGSDGQADVYESGIWTADLGAYAPGDVFRVAVEGGVVKYYKNWSLVYTSQVAPTFPLLVDASLWGANATINDAVIGFGAPVAENVVWTNLVDATATGNSLQKTGGCDGCQNAGATSQQQILSGDGYIEFTAGETTTTRGAGLSNGDTDTSGADVDFAVALWNDGQASVYESGAWKADLFAYAPGDVFRVAVEGGVVKYYKNGSLRYTSLVAPIFPLLVDTSLLGADSTVRNAVIYRIP
jgi:hypothetical protein